MKRIARKNILIERAHKAFVVGCIATTLYGFVHYCTRWYRYFTVLKPDIQQQELARQQELLAEGSSELLKDSSKDLNT